VRVLADDDLSAYDGRRRPAYERLLAGLGDEEFDVVMAWKLDRLTRSGIRGLTPLLDALDAAGGSLGCVHGQVDPARARGRGRGLRWCVCTTRSTRRARWARESPVSSRRWRRPRVRTCRCAHAERRTS